MRNDDEVLVKFCTVQSRLFNENDWISNGFEQADNLKIAALLLASVDWYSSHKQIQQFCLQQGWLTASLPQLVKNARFDCPRFLAMLRKSLAIT